MFTLRPAEGGISHVSASHALREGMPVSGGAGATQQLAGDIPWRTFHERPYASSEGHNVGHDNGV